MDICKQAACKVSCMEDLWDRNISKPSKNKVLHAHTQPESKALRLQDHSFKMQILLAQSWINTDGEGGQVCYTSVHTGCVPLCAGTSTESGFLEGCQQG